MKTIRIVSQKAKLVGMIGVKPITKPAKHHTLGQKCSLLRYADSVLLSIFVKGSK